MPIVSTTTTTYTCDRCGRTTNDGSDGSTALITTLLNAAGGDTQNTIWLCASCLALFHQWLATP